MDIEGAINLVDKLVYQKTNEHLNSMQISLLRGVWFEQSYPEIAANCYCSVSYLKAQGSGFWKGLSQVLGEKVTKKNLRTILESYQQDLKAGKLRSHRIQAIDKQKKLPKPIHHPFYLTSNETLDSWFDSSILLQLTHRLDNFLEATSTLSQRNKDDLQLLSEKLKLIHCLNIKKYLLNRESVNIINICRCLINDLKIDFPNREIIVSLFEDPILPHYDVTMTTLIDKKLVKNILKELLFNALQYSSAESPVTLDINVENRKGTFSIIDQGIGINPDELSQIFLPFYCATNVSQKSRDGLGLTIVEKSVRLHQGEISVMTQLQKGSIFTVVLPVA